MSSILDNQTTGISSDYVRYALTDKDRYETNKNNYFRKSDEFCKNESVKRKTGLNTGGDVWK